MKIRFNSSVQVEIDRGLQYPIDTILRKGRVLEVETVETNDAFQTATVRISETETIYGLPLGVFSVVEEA